VDPDEQPHPDGVERRVGRRVEVPHLRGRWTFRKPRKLRPPATLAAEARVVDLSVTGALLEAPTSAYVVPDVVVGIEFMGHRGRAVVRHVRTGDRGETLYGVEFLYLEPRLRELVYRAVTKEDLRRDWHWAIAR
jgi:hypothetical protein